MRGDDYVTKKHSVVLMKFEKIVTKNVFKFNAILKIYRTVLKPIIERTTCTINMIASAFDRHDVTLSNDNKIKIEKHLEGSKIQ